jgi:RNA polymerase sigma factor (sigma-70 family)
VLQEDISNDELVFLIRSKESMAFDILAKRMKSKQERLIHQVLKDNRYCGLDENDLLIVALDALFIAIDSYDPLRTVFDAYYHFILNRELIHALQRHSTGAQNFLNTAMSFDEEIEEGTSLYDLIGKEDETIKFGNDGGLKQLLHHPVLKLNAMQKVMIQLRTLGYSYEEIAQQLKLNYRQVSRQMIKLMKVYQTLKE